MSEPFKYNIHSKESIISYAQKLVNHTLRDVCEEEIKYHKIKGKGSYGNILEKFYFGYEPNSEAEPDFLEAGIELKSSPLKVLKNGEFRSKERLVLNIINYLEVHKEDFNNSSFWKKNSHLLIIFYLHDKELNQLDYIIKLVADWKYPIEDLEIIKRDWELINGKIRNGKAHELSEGDTFYLGACTKGATALKSLRDQPFNKQKAKQRAYSLKQGYVNHILARLTSKQEAVYGKIIKDYRDFDSVKSIENYVIEKFRPFYGKSAEQIEKDLALNLNKHAKGYFASLTNAILGMRLGQKIEEFEKADIQVKTVRLKENNLPKEDISFPTFKYQELVTMDWEDADFKNILESKFFFVFYRFEQEGLILKRVKFWNMPPSDIDEAKKIWDKMVGLIKQGKIVREISEKGIRKTYFPKKTENRISHVRPHARNAADTFDLPVADQLTGLTRFTKHCFWLNAKYVRDNIYLFEL